MLRIEKGKDIIFRAFLVVYGKKTAKIEAGNVKINSIINIVLNRKNL